MAIEIPVYQPDLSGNEKKYLSDCIDSSWISSKGRFLNDFEEGFKEFVAAKHATAVSNGTVALHLALVALGVGPGDEIIVPTLTYIASVNAIMYCGARPVFVDSVEDSWQMDPTDVKKKITKKTKAILAVHLYGGVCDMDRLSSIAHEYGLFLVEDCAEAIGSYYKEQHVGSWGDISTYSFYGNKTITCGEGGMVITNDETLFRRVVHYKGQGLAQHREYWHDVIGFNYRMTNLSAAVGLAQLERIHSFLERKKLIAKKYIQFLKDVPVAFQDPGKDCKHSYWMVSILAKSASDRDRLREFLLERGVETRPLFYPVHSMPMYADAFTRFPVAESLGWRGVNLPSWPGLKDEEIQHICGIVHEYYTK